MIDWHVVQVRHSFEEKAAEEISRHGFEAYLPTLVLMRADGTRRKVARFGGYVFAAFDGERDAWGKLIRHDARPTAIKRVLCCSTTGKPSRVPSQAIDALRAYEPQAMDDAKVIARFRPGEPVELFVNGSATKAVFVSQDKARAFVRVWILGAERLLQVAASAVVRP